MKAVRWRILIVIGALALVTFLFFKSRTIDFDKHERFYTALQQLRQVDADLNQDLLKIGYALITSYDPVNAKLAEIARLRTRLEPLPEFLDAATRLEAEAALAEFDQALGEKRDAFGDFQDANIRLKISLPYLPILSSELADLAAARGNEGKLAAEVRNLLRDVLLYALSPEESMRDRIVACLATIDRLAAGSPGVDRGDLELMANHVRTILDFKPRVDALNARLVELPTGRALLRLQEVYDRAYQQVSLQAENYRSALYVFSIGLLVFIFYTLYRLWQTTEELNDVNERLEERVSDRTQELAASQERNRALLNAIPDAMIRISGDGTVLDAKTSLMVPLNDGDNLTGKHIKTVLPEMANDSMKAVEQALETGVPQLVESEREIGGEPRDLESRVVVAGEDQALLIIRDITEQKHAAEKLAKAQQRSEQLLHNILPVEVAEELKKKGMVDPKYFEDVTILFTNFEGFGNSTDELAAEELVQVLHEYFTAFDEITVRYGLEKLKTVGDQYICVGGLPKRRPSHPVDVVMAALEMVEAVRRRDKSDGLVHWGVRIGVHTGPVVAGVVGFQKFAFDIWGQAVNFSSRVEADGQANRVHLSADTQTRVKDFFAVEHNGKLKTRYRELDTYFVQGLHPSLRNGDRRIPPRAFVNRYRIYFQSEPPSFPRHLVEPDS